MPVPARSGGPAPGGRLDDAGVLFHAERARGCMSLDIETPPPPELPEMAPDAYDDADVSGDDYRRAELAAFLEEGA